MPEHPDDDTRDADPRGPPTDDKGTTSINLHMKDSVQYVGPDTRCFVNTCRSDIISDDDAAALLRDGIGGQYDGALTITDDDAAAKSDVAPSAGATQNFVKLAQNGGVVASHIPGREMLVIGYVPPSALHFAPVNANAGVDAAPSEATTVLKCFRFTHMAELPTDQDGVDAAEYSDTAEGFIKRVVAHVTGNGIVDDEVRGGMLPARSVLVEAEQNDDEADGGLREAILHAFLVLGIADKITRPRL